MRDEKRVHFVRYSNSGFIQYPDYIQEKKMDFFFDQKVTTTQTATSMTEEQFGCLSSCLGKMEFAGFYDSFDNEEFMSRCVEVIKSRLAKSGMTFVNEVTDDGMSVWIGSLISRYGELDYSIAVSGYANYHSFYSPVYVSAEDAKGKTADDMVDYVACEVSCGMTNIEWEGNYEVQETFVDDFTTNVRVKLPTPEVFGITPLKEVA
jgi:hypothetical protein